jgi:beta-galactosidase
MREIIAFNRGWRFHRGELTAADCAANEKRGVLVDESRTWLKADNNGVSKPDYSCADAWRTVDLPHDFVIEGEFTKAARRDNGSLPGGTAWYYRRFDLPEADRGRRIHLELDGVYRDCTVFANGHYMGRHRSGYTSFGFDVTEVCRFGAANAVAVHVDATENELWSYEGGGIYRGVRMVKTAPLFVPQWGVSVATGVGEDAGRADIRVAVRNMAYDPVDAAVLCRVISPDGREAAAAEAARLAVGAIGQAEAVLTLRVGSPALWSVDSPALYRLVAEIRVKGDLVDRCELPFGFRWFRFDPDTGFSLNGVGMKLKGVCCHQDHGCVGTAVPPALHEWRVRRLKDMGCNAIRTSHNPPDPALLDACDRLGMMVMDELRMPGACPELLGDFESQVLRDRSHPSVILWSLGNEEMGIQKTEAGLAIFRRLQHAAHTLDPSRPTTYAMNCDWITISRFHDENGFRFDVFGANYRNDQNSGRYDEFHRRHPDWPLIGSETWGGVATRGLYEPDKATIPISLTPRFDDDPGTWRDAKYRHFASAYGGTFTPWGYSIEETWRDCAERPFMAGTFIWTGFDYRGETFPYEWPAVVTRFGLIDLCGFRKEAGQYLRAWWRPNDPFLFLMPHWNWEGREGEEIDVWCYANCAQVELLLNGRSLGRREMPVNFRLEWKVPYAPGTLEARGFDAGGREAASMKRRTARAPAAVRVWADRDRISADGEDVIVVNAAVEDGDGEVCPRADNVVEFQAEGPVEILGVGNGNPVSHEPDKFTNRRQAFHGLCQVILRSTGAPGRVIVRAASSRLEGGTLTVIADG